MVKLLQSAHFLRPQMKRKQVRIRGDGDGGGGSLRSEIYRLPRLLLTEEDIAHQDIRKHLAAVATAATGPATAARSSVADRRPQCSSDEASALGKPTSDALSTGNLSLSIAAAAVVVDTQ